MFSFPKIRTCGLIWNQGNIFSRLIASSVWVCCQKATWDVSKPPSLSSPSQFCTKPARNEWIWSAVKTFLGDIIASLKKWGRCQPWRIDSFSLYQGRLRSSDNKLRKKYLGHVILFDSSQVDMFCRYYCSRKNSRQASCLACNGISIPSLTLRYQKLLWKPSASARTALVRRRGRGRGREANHLSGRNSRDISQEILYPHIKCQFRFIFVSQAGKKNSKYIFYACTLELNAQFLACIVSAPAYWACQ